MSARNKVDFDELVRDHGKAVLRYAMFLTNDNWLADDVTQETFLRAWRYFPTFRGESTVESWLIRICRNVAFTMLGKVKPTVTLHEFDAIHVEARFASLEINELLLHVPLIHREVLYLVDVLGYDYERASEVLEVPLGTLRSRLARARSLLRKVVKDSSELEIAQNCVVRGA